MNIEWIVIRGSGLVAFALLAMATIWGLLMSTKMLGKAVKAKPLTYFHESLGLGALLATVVHLVFLAVDDYVEFGAAELFVPGMSEWEPVAVALGVMSFYALVVVSLSFYVKRWIGHETWRSIHFLGFGGFLASMLHGVMAGADRAHPAVLGMYITSGLLVFGLMAVRVLSADNKSAAGRRVAPARTS
ncbi:MAG: ferric reductase-like transmembrane domain-containing protein [Actinomycetota bacterium]|nr:ferric reductase-like transmembrane domain-containing protein [Actinomycetota bacterium]